MQRAPLIGARREDVIPTHHGENLLLQLPCGWDPEGEAQTCLPHWSPRWYHSGIGVEYGMIGLISVVAAKLTHENPWESGLGNVAGRRIVKLHSTKQTL